MATNTSKPKTKTSTRTLKQKVDAAQRRQAERSEPTLLDRAGESAIEAKDKFAAFAKEHPIATVAGGVALGLLVAGMFKGPRRAAAKGGTKMAGLATLGAELAVAYAAKAYEAAREAGDDSLDWLSELGGAVGERARSLSADAADYAAGARDSVMESGKSAAKSVRSRFN